MKSFLKSFLAALLALFVFSFLGFFLFMGMVVAIGSFSKSDTKIDAKSVLQIDLSNKYEEQRVTNYQSILKTEGLDKLPGLYDVIRLIKKAKTDDHIKGIYIIANTNSNGFASSDEIRNALMDFKGSKKFVFAYGDVMSQGAYSIANIADRVYVSPKGYFEWLGYSVNYMFVKGALDKLDIKPQIFYAGKFKSATEPFRGTEMSDANELQTRAWLNDLYADFLQKTSEQRKLDSAHLHQLANTGAIETPQDAVAHQLIDGVRYDDEVKDEIKKAAQIPTSDKISFLPIEKYYAASSDLNGKGEKIALVYATGDIVDGKGGEGKIGSTEYVDLLRKARLDDGIKAVVVRVNSGGGSALASENIWREMNLVKKTKPLIVSFGDVAASGGYYISCAADSIFASRSSITGSIGVFGLIPDMSSFFKNKLGVTFDGVGTGPLANAGSIDHPMSPREQQLVKNSIETIYASFKQRVADGRKKDTAYIETVAQGRVWSGVQGKQVGLVDVFGGLDDAIKAAAAKARLKDYEIKEYPVSKNIIERILGLSTDNSEAQLKKTLGEDYYKVYKQVKQVKEMTNSVQARMPFEFTIR